ncbi:hypothetical protein EUGRSUZ_I02553 [Eucalyptus grandis]|uniref:Uncharacterized protein n=2 Tax=Eucalyptus grandis TaxID=71139 RepID=A0ACC3JJ11_EUCGR|nr:hypothetical protein EUGRSUZ_I02553 [Eucalyptus grandis]
MYGVLTGVARLFGFCHSSSQQLRALFGLSKCTCCARECLRLFTDQLSYGLSREWEALYFYGFTQQECS